MELTPEQLEAAKAVIAQSVAASPKKRTPRNLPSFGSTPIPVDKRDVVIVAQDSFGPERGNDTLDAAEKSFATALAGARAAGVTNVRGALEWRKETVIPAAAVTPAASSKKKG